MEGEGEGKRVSWVELYLDLIFVLAVGQLSQLIVNKPEMHTVWVALGLFFTLWWTWIGFAVLYNRFGVDKAPQRLLFLAGSIPTGTAAVAIQPASTGDVTAFAISLAVTRVVLAAANAIDGGWHQVLRGRLTVSYLISVVLFVGSIWVPEPFRYVLWFLAITLESGALLHEDKRAMRRARESTAGRRWRPRTRPSAWTRITSPSASACSSSSCSARWWSRPGRRRSTGTSRAPVAGPRWWRR